MKKNVKEGLLITLGILLVSIALYFFFMPDDLAVGGASGLAIVINHWIPFLSIGTLMIIINIVLFTVGFLIIGNSFGFKTIYASLGTSFMVSVFEKMIPSPKPLVDEIMLQLIMGVIISAIGMAIVFNQNASTGGTDIIAKIMNKFWGIDLGKGVLFADFFITLMAGFAFGPKMAVYAILGVIMNGIVIDATIEGMNLSKKVNIVSDHSDAIKEYIVNDLERGGTVYRAEGAYTGKDKNVLITVVDRKDFIKLKNYIKSIDENAFVTVSNVNEVLGDGFKSIS